MWRMVSTVCFVAFAVSATAFGLPPVNNPPATINHMQLQLDGVLVGTLSDCGPFGSETRVVEIRRSMPNGRTDIIKTPGDTIYPTVVCKRNLSNDTAFSAWRNLIETGAFQTARKDGAFIFLDQGGQEVLRYNFINGWPSKLMIDWQGAASAEPVTEEISIEVEALTRP